MSHGWDHRIRDVKYGLVHQWFDNFAQKFQPEPRGGSEEAGNTPVIIVVGACRQGCPLIVGNPEGLGNQAEIFAMYRSASRANVVVG